MNFGQVPPHELGSSWTKFRDALNPVKQIKQGTELTAAVISKLGIKELNKFAELHVKAITKVDDEVSRAGKNPHLIKIVTVIVAAVLTYFGQVSLALAVLEAGFKYAEGVKARNIANATNAQIAQDDYAAEMINELIGFMAEQDQLKVINAYNLGGHSALQDPDIIAILDKARQLKDFDFFANVKNKVDESHPRNSLKNYICRAISYATNIPIQNPSGRATVCNNVLNYIDGALSALPILGYSMVIDAITDSGPDAFKRADFNAVIMPIVKGGVDLIQSSTLKLNAYISPIVPLYYDANGNISRSGEITPYVKGVRNQVSPLNPQAVILPGPPTTPENRQVIPRISTSEQIDYKKYIPIAALIGLIFL